MVQSTKGARRRNKFQLLGPIIVVVVIVVVAGLAVWYRSQAKPSAAVKPSPTPALKGPGKIGNAPSGPNTVGATPSVAPTIAPNPGHPASSLAMPILIDSSDTASLGSNIESTCQSVPGAQCYIQASMDGRVLNVSQTETIPDSGSDGVILNWDTQQLTTGTWQIQAVATFDGQTALSDPDNLRVN